MLCKLQSSSLIGQCAGHLTCFLKSYDFTSKWQTFGWQLKIALNFTLPINHFKDFMFSVVKSNNSWEPSKARSTKSNFWQNHKDIKNKHLFNFHKRRDVFSFLSVIFYDKSCLIPSKNCKENDE